MDEEEALEIGQQFNVESNAYLKHEAKGYLEAIKKAEGLAVALKQIKGNRNAMDGVFGLVDISHRVAREALEGWERVK